MLLLKKQFLIAARKSAVSRSMYRILAVAKQVATCN